MPLQPLRLQDGGVKELLQIDLHAWIARETLKPPLGRGFE
jgi:hypothetical protein